MANPDGAFTREFEVTNGSHPTMKILVTILVVLGGVVSLDAGNWRPPERLLDAVREVESNAGVFTSGDRGKSLGHFQLKKSAWTDVVEWRRKQNLPTHDYQKNVLKEKISRLYAADFLTILHDNLLQQYRREPTPAEIYAAYNLGLSRFRKCHYSLAQVNPMTEARCRQVEALLE